MPDPRVQSLSFVPTEAARFFDQHSRFRHVIGFAALVIVLSAASWSAVRGLPFIQIVGTGLGLMAFAGVLEILQHWVPRRSPGWLDWWASCAGIVVGMALVALAVGSWRWFMQGRKPKDERPK